MTAKTICITISKVLEWTPKSCSIGINRFWLFGLDGNFPVLPLSGKTRFWFVWLIKVLNRPQNKLKRSWKSICVIMARDCSSSKDWSHEWPRFNRKRLEKCFVEKRQPYQPKLAAVETVYLKRTRPWLTLATDLHFASGIRHNKKLEIYKRDHFFIVQFIFFRSISPESV